MTDARDDLSISIVVPLLNERPTLDELHRRLAATLASITPRYEIVFVDDGSTDGSIEVIRALRAKDARVRYLRFRRNFGKSAALAAGFRAARHEVIVTIDADMQESPEELAALIAKLGEGFDLVSAWRRHRKDPLSRRAGSVLYNWITRQLTGVHLHDINCGFKCYTRRVLDEVLVYGERHRYIPVLASYRGFRMAEVPVEHAPRRHGRSRYGMDRILGGFFTLLTVILVARYTNRPLHFFGLLGLSLAAVGVVLAGSVTLDYLMTPGGVNQPLLVLGTVLVIVGVQFLLFGLLAELIVFSYRRDGDYAVIEASEDQRGTGA
jgi:glycosyltransferase involved in cell wall biosynthesis